MAESDRTIKQLKTAIDTDLSTFVQKYIVELKATTPVATGRARNGWVNSYKKGKVGSSGTYPIAVNNVRYSGILDDGWSQQAPRGIVQPALQKTRKR